MDCPEISSCSEEKSYRSVYDDFFKLGTFALHTTHNSFRELNFDVDQFAVDVNAFLSYLVHAVKAALLQCQLQRL